MEEINNNQNQPQDQSVSDMDHSDPGQSQDPKDQKIRDLESNWRRALADYKNLERRVNEERASVMAFSNLLLLERLIPVLDNLENLCAHLKDQGLDIITKELRNLIMDEGVEEIKALDASFDPTTMEASEVVEGEDGKVMEVVNKGYKLQDKVIRPARVKVGKKKLE